MSWRHQEFRDADDVYTEYDDLEEQHTSLKDALSEAREELEAVDKDDLAEQVEATEAVVEALRELNEWEQENLERLNALKDFCDDLDSYGGGRQENETLIAEENFADYAEQLAEDIKPSASIDYSTWPLNCIDWEKAAKDLRYDYTEHEFQGTTYLFRCY